MKRAIIILTIAALAFAGCKSTRQTTTLNDDVYAPRSNKAAFPVSEQDYTVAQPAGTGTTQVYALPDSVSLTGSPASAAGEDYSENDYTARIQRFHNSDGTSGYYDEVYVEEEPSVNVYLGASCGSWYGPSFGFGWSYGYPYYYDYWGYPYYWRYPYYYGYPYYWGYGGYSSGYWNGYYNGYWDGYYGYPYNPYPYYDYPYGSYYYGSRRMITTTGRTVEPRSERQSVPGTVTATPGTREVPAQINTRSSSPQRYQYTQQPQQRQAPAQRSNTTYERQKQQPAPRYTKPGAGTSTQRSQGVPSTSRNYTPPAYRQPRSSQEYINPRAQTPATRQPASTGSQNRTAPSTTISKDRTTSPTPARTNPTYSSPSRTTPSYSSPSRSSGSYSAPSRSSGNSYSAPSRSSGSSYSAPSRSGGSSGGSSSGGSSSGSSGGGSRSGGSSGGGRR